MSPSGQQGPHWFSRNSDIIAATFIVVFAAVGTAATSWVTSPSFGMDRIVMQPRVETVRPHLTQIRTETRQAADEIRQEIERARRDVQGDFCQMKGDIHQVGRETAQIKQNMRQLRNEFREEIRGWFRH
jgi:hypothetical protein